MKKTLDKTHIRYGFVSWRVNGKKEGILNP
jgi:hypothetical protein